MSSTTLPSVAWLVLAWKSQENPSIGLGLQIGVEISTENNMVIIISGPVFLATRGLPLDLYRDFVQYLRI